MKPTDFTDLFKDWFRCDREKKSNRFLSPAGHPGQPAPRAEYNKIFLQTFQDLVHNE